MSKFFRILALIFAGLFIWAAILQYNDPDYLLWYGLYGVSAVASLLFSLNRLPFGVALLLFLAYLIGAYFDWPAKFEGYDIGEGEITNIEKAREASGLLLCALVMLLYAWRIRKTGSKV